MPPQVNTHGSQNTYQFFMREGSALVEILPWNWNGERCTWADQYFRWERHKGSRGPACPGKPMHARQARAAAWCHLPRPHTLCCRDWFDIDHSVYTAYFRWAAVHLLGVSSNPLCCPCFAPVLLTVLLAL